MEFPLFRKLPEPASFAGSTLPADDQLHERSNDRTYFTLNRYLHTEGLFLGRDGCTHRDGLLQGAAGTHARPGGHHCQEDVCQDIEHSVTRPGGGDQRQRVP